MKYVSHALAAVGVAAIAATAVLPTASALAAPKFENHGSYGTYNNYRGDRDQHSGYRYYNGFWFPPAAFVAGAIVGGLVAGGQPQTYAYAPAYPATNHLAWCESNYRSYSPATDSFLGYDGYYHRCISPY